MILYFFSPPYLLDRYLILLVLNHIIMHFLCSSTFIKSETNKNTPDKIDKASKNSSLLRLKTNIVFILLNYLNLRKEIADYQSICRKDLLLLLPSATEPVRSGTFFNPSVTEPMPEHRFRTCTITGGALCLQLGYVSCNPRSLPESLSGREKH